jgi:hypothetical protein
MISIRTEHFTNTNERVIVGFKLVQRLRVNVDLFHGCLHLTDADSVTDVSEEPDVFFYSVKVIRLGKYLSAYRSMS